ncbi:MAG: trypsin-like serine protease [Bdellovibrionota bacterium]
MQKLRGSCRKWVVLSMGTILVSACVKNGAPVVGTSPSSPSILGGRVVEAAEPLAGSVVGILVMNESGAFAGNCTGTLISPNAVLTAAHCFNRGSSTKSKVVFDVHPGDAYFKLIDLVQSPDGVDTAAVIAAASKIANVEKIEIHPDYAEIEITPDCDGPCPMKITASNTAHDVAILRVSGPAIEKRVHIPVVDSKAEPGKKIVALGFGVEDKATTALDLAGVRKLRLKTATFDVVRTEEAARKRFKEIGITQPGETLSDVVTFLLENPKILTVSSFANESILPGDSGGPAITSDASGAARTTGVASRVIDANDKTFVATYTNLSDSELNAWVKEKIEAFAK